MSLSEKLVWFRLRGRPLSKFKFRRNVSVGPHLLDFYCPACKLAIEIDEETPVRPQDCFDIKQRCLSSYGINMLRFTKREVFHDLDTVMQHIQRRMRVAFQQGVLFQGEERLPLQEYLKHASRHSGKGEAHGRQTFAVYSCEKFVHLRT